MSVDSRYIEIIENKMLQIDNLKTVISALLNACAMSSEKKDYVKLVVKSVESGGQYVISYNLENKLKEEEE